MCVLFYVQSVVKRPYFEACRRDLLRAINLPNGTESLFLLCFSQTNPQNLEMDIGDGVRAKSNPFVCQTLSTSIKRIRKSHKINRYELVIAEPPFERRKPCRGRTSGCTVKRVLFTYARGWVAFSLMNSVCLEQRSVYRLDDFPGEIFQLH